MLKKILKVTFPQNCIGCELCMMEAQRQLKRVGLEGALIRILLSADGYSVVMDPQINKLDIQKFKDVCPTAVFAIQEE